MVTTNFELVGYRLVKNLGVVRGITVRSRSIFGNLVGGWQTLVGGKLSICVELCEKTRDEAFHHMLQHAESRSANAVIAMRYDANGAMSGVNGVLAYERPWWKGCSGEWMPASPHGQSLENYQ